MTAAGNVPVAGGMDLQAFAYCVGIEEPPGAALVEQRDPEGT